ncbi:MAG: anthranilate synthase component I family protein [Deltaproteobacteria bacterium]|nr:anthranilate synthase component I family protein [Deltaproteobacteria bacterium]
MLVKKIISPFVSPIELLEVLPKGSRFLLESTLISKEHRYALLGFDPSGRFSSSHWGGACDLFTEWSRLLESSGAPDSRLPFCGGWVGGLSYEASQLFEDIPVHEDSIGLPHLFFYYVDHFFLFDLWEKSLQIIAIGHDRKECQSKIDKLDHYVSRVSKHKDREGTGIPFPLERLQSFSNFTPEHYLATIKRIQEFIRSGHSYQVNLAQRFTLPSIADPLAIYRELSRISPVPFASYFEWDDIVILSASPERLFKKVGRNIHTRPIAGTRRMGSPEELAKFIKELASDPKECAEHAMLVDLARNDLGRICEFGTVKVDKFMEFVPYSYVIHTESDVIGKLRSDVSFWDIFRAVFPGGTITGVPKIRTMEIIHELEPHNRSIYTGSLGYISRCGNMDFNIMIRSIVCKRDKAYTWAGGGITFDAIPEREYKETLNKAKPQLIAIASRNPSLNF